MAERSIASDCKSDAFGLRRFESCSQHYGKYLIIAPRHRRGAFGLRRFESCPVHEHKNIDLYDRCFCVMMFGRIRTGKGSENRKVFRGGSAETDGFQKILWIQNFVRILPCAHSWSVPHSLPHSILKIGSNLVQ